jgi:ParB-like chromosome segregation protein Spo0J
MKFFESRKARQDSGEVRLMAKVATLRLDPKNARSHDERNIAEIASSLQEHGQRKPIVVNAGGVVVAGNGTLLAARKLGWTEIWCTSGCDLSYIQQRRYALADNRTAELATWEERELVRELTEIKEAEGDLDGTGFTDEEFADMLANAEDVDDAEAPPPAPDAMRWPGGMAAISERESAALTRLASEHGGSSGFVSWLLKSRRVV